MKWTVEIEINDKVIADTDMSLLDKVNVIDLVKYSCYYDLLASVNDAKIKILKSPIEGEIKKLQELVFEENGELIDWSKSYEVECND